MKDTIAIVSCVWGRPERLQGLLERLAGQSDQNFVLFLINNNLSLKDFVDECLSVVPYRVEVKHNLKNYGSFARLLLMTEQVYQYRWFLTIDDDMDFGLRWLESWRSQIEPDTLLGWKGFDFISNYWDRAQIAEGEDAEFLLGSNLLIPASAIDSRLLSLREDRWMIEDLWLSYHASHLKGFPLKVAQDTGVRPVIDGKDSYTGLHREKIDFLQELRRKGWQV